MCPVVHPIKWGAASNYLFDLLLAVLLIVCTVNRFTHAAHHSHNSTDVEDGFDWKQKDIKYEFFRISVYRAFSSILGGIWRHRHIDTLSVTFTSMVQFLVVFFSLSSFFCWLRLRLFLLVASRRRIKTLDDAHETTLRRFIFKQIFSFYLSIFLDLALRVSSVFPCIGRSTGSPY